MTTDSVETISLKQTKSISVLSLFTSASTLICCAIPALLVSIGAGAALSSVISSVPQLVWFSEHKTLVFSFAATMLVISGMFQWRAQYLPCPADINLAEVCQRTRKFSLRLYLVSVAIYITGVFFAFIAPWLNGGL